MRITDEWKDRKIALLKFTLERITTAIYLADHSRENGLPSFGDWRVLVSLAKEAEETLL